MGRLRVRFRLGSPSRRRTLPPLQPADFVIKIIASLILCLLHFLTPSSSCIYLCKGRMIFKRARAIYQMTFASSQESLFSNANNYGMYGAFEKVFPFADASKSVIKTTKSPTRYFVQCTSMPCIISILPPQSKNCRFLLIE